MKKKTGISLSIMLAVFVAASFVMLWRQSQPAPDIYDTLMPEIRDIRKESTATGALEARTQVSYKSKVTGTVKKLYVKAGQTVRTGDRIATISVIPDAVLLSNANSEVNSASIELGEAEREAERAQKLYDKGALSRQAYEQASTRLDGARERLENARDRVEAIKRGASGRTDDDNSTIRAMAEGTVLSVDVEEGATVLGTSSFTQGNTIATVADMDDIIFHGTVDETQVAGLREGMKVNIIPAAIPGMTISAVLEYISRTGIVENGTKMFELKAGADIPEGFTVRNGYSANARVVQEEATGVLSVSEAAISFEQNGTFVYRLTSPLEKKRAQKWERIPVKTGVSNGIYIEIKEGVREGDILRGLKK